MSSIIQELQFYEVSVMSYKVHEVIYEEDEFEMIEMDNPQNEYEDDFLSKVDNTWMMNEAEEWNMLQNSAQNLSEMIEKLESKVENNFQSLTEKITGIEKEDLDKTEKLLQNFKTRWLTKCKETENLRISLKRATHESTRVNDEYHEMETSITKMRQQFGKAIDSSVTEMEELTICNNALSETIQELESKIIRGEKAFKQNAKDNLDSLRQIITIAENDDVNMRTLRTRLKKEADKIDRMIVVEDLFSSDKTQTNSNLAEKSQKMVDAISQGLVETLKQELRESRNIAENQRRRIKDLEREKEEFLENQLALKNDGVEEMNELLGYLRKSVLQRTPDGNDDDKSDFNIVKRNFNTMKNLINSMKDGLDKSYKKVASKSSEIIDLNDNIKDRDDQVKQYITQVETLESEKSRWKLKLEQSESQYQLATNELHTVQERLKTLEGERKILLEETQELKGGKENIQTVCSSLSGENENLVQRVKTMQTERDKVFTDLHEQIQKLNQYSIENNELENKCENLELAISKLRREYQDQTREMNILTRENDERKTSLQDVEQEKIKLKRTVKSVETRNKDLEDQMFQLTNEKQKLTSELEKSKKTYESHEETCSELTRKLETSREERGKIEEKIRSVEKEKKDVEEKNKELASSLQQDEELRKKHKLLLSSYEKLLIKLLHQRKEMLELLNLNKTSEFKDVFLQVSSTQSVDYKDISQIEKSIKSTVDETDSTFEGVTTAFRRATTDVKLYHNFCTELTNYMKNFDDPDSCYSTENDISEPALFVPGRDVSDGKRGLSALKTIPKSDHELLPKLMNKIRNCMQQGNPDSNREISELKRKLNISNKRVRQLTTKLKSRKTLEASMRNKISHMKKELKVFKESHKTYHANIKNTPSSPQHTPSKEQTPFVSVDIEDIIFKLKATEEELKTVRNTLNECTDENCKNKVAEGLEVVDTKLTELSNQLAASSNIRLVYSESTAEPDDLNERFGILQDQRHYMLEHLTFTNKRLEVLLNCLKGKNDVDKNNNNSHEATIQEPVFTKRVLKRVRDSFKSDQAVMKKACSILELTKAISITDLSELAESKAINEEQREMIVLVKDMNENMESVLREARSNITGPKVDKVMDQPQKGAPQTELASSETSKQGEKENELIPKSEFLQKENEMKASLEKAQKKVENLSQFLKQREEEIKERDELIAKLNKEYEELKSKTIDQNDINIATRDRMIKAYANAKKRLEKENEFLQLVVKEVREELLNFQKTYKKEEETQQHLQEFVNELQICKSSLEHSLDRMAYELNIVKRDRDHLMKTVHSMGIQNNYHNHSWYGETIPMNPGMYNGYHGDQYCPECDLCAFQDFSASTTLPFSEDEWDCTGSCDGFESLPSDGEQADVVSSSESQTSSRVAKTIRTEEAAEAIKAKNRPDRYARKEKSSGNPLLSPKLSRSRSKTSPSADVYDNISMASTINSARSGRVQGRREQLLQGHGPGNNPGIIVSSRRSSQESSVSSNNSRNRSSPDVRHRNSFPNNNNLGHPNQILKNPVLDIDSAVEMAATSQQQYYEDRNMTPISPRNQLVSPFLKTNNEVKKRKKKFLAFGKK